jgi:hypothetical protein
MGPKKFFNGRATSLGNMDKKNKLTADLKCRHPGLSLIEGVVPFYTIEVGVCADKPAPTGLLVPVDLKLRMNMYRDREVYDWVIRNGFIESSKPLQNKSLLGVISKARDFHPQSIA